MGVVLPADDVLVAGLRAGDEETFACLLHRARAAVRGHPRVLLRHEWGRDMTCAELVELVTAFLDGALDPEAEQRFVEHLASCDGCQTYVDQMRRTIAEVGQVEPESLSEQTRDRLLEAFRTFPRD